MCHLVIGQCHETRYSFVFFFGLVTLLTRLARTELHSTILLSQPHNIAQILSSEVLLAPPTDIKLKHGVIGLLKHLSQSSCNSPANRAMLGKSGVMERLLASGVLDERNDAMANAVQMNAIGTMKHLCNGSSMSFSDIRVCWTTELC